MTVHIPHLTRRNLIVIGCCLLVALAAVFFGPVLQVQQQKSLDRQIAAGRDKAAILQRAAEMRQQLQGRIARLQPTAGPQLVTQSALPSAQADQVFADLHRLADKAGLELVAVRPMLESMGHDSNSMQIGATFNGGMTGLQDLLNALLQIPYVERLQEMIVSVDAEGLELEIDFFVRIQ